MNTDPSRYQDEGYCVIRDVVPPETIAQHVASLARMLEALPTDRRPESLVEPHIHAPDWQTWLDLGRHDAILAAVSRALRSSELLLLSTHLLVKPPGDGLAVKWHQDNTYWPSVTGTDVCTVWLALERADVENGCMRIIPRTHVGYPSLDASPTDGTDLLGVELRVDELTANDAIPVELAAGDISIHDSYVIHGSEPNRSTRRRAGLTLRYANAETVAVDLESHGKPVYYVSGRGGARCRDGMRDIRLGQRLPDGPGEHRSRRFQRDFGARTPPSKRASETE